MASTPSDIPLQLKVVNDSTPSINNSNDSSLSKYKYSIEPRSSNSSSKASNNYKLKPYNANENRLEVESTSTMTSIPISIPYYYYHLNSNDKNNSLDTVNLLSGPNISKYSNTSHMNDTSKESPTNTNNSSKPVRILEGNSDSKETGIPESNQVPKRFSQFIIDQKNLVNNTNNNQSESENSLQSAFDRRTYNNSSSRHNRTSQSNSTGVITSGSKYSNNLNNVSRRGTRSIISNSAISSGEISNSMGSQATIFSTRQETYLLNNRSKLRKGKPKTKARLYTTDSDISTLSRSRAIKFKEGGWLYRLKLRLNRMLTKFKHLKFMNFRVSSKRSSSLSKSKSNKKQMGLKRNKSTISRSSSVAKNPFYQFNNKNKNKQSIRNLISAPTNNPHLGYNKAERVDAIDDELKKLAGAPEDTLQLTHGPRSRTRNLSFEGKYNHLSTYIDQQQNNYNESNKHRFGSSGTRSNSTRDQLITNSQILHNDRHYHNHSSLDPAKVSLGNSSSSFSDNTATEISAETTPPIPPSHQLEYTFESLATYDNPQHQVNDLWKSYLSHVICQRIKLRQEISQFQTFVLDQDLLTKNKNNFRIFEDNKLVEEHKNDEENTLNTPGEDNNSIKSPSRSSDNYTDTTSEITNDGSEFDIELDSTTEKFNAKFNNRRSMLGNMLDYESENDAELINSGFSESQTESNSGSESHTSSNGRKLDEISNSMSSDIIINKKYGTISRNNSRLGSSRSNKYTNTNSNSINQPLMYAIKRSNGFQDGLNSV